jgi:hypothetical protein
MVAERLGMGWRFQQNASRCQVDAQPRVVRVALDGRAQIGPRRRVFFDLNQILSQGFDG